MINIEFKPGKYILSDSRQWMLGKLIEEKNKKLIKTYGYFSEFSSLMKGLFEEELRESDATSISELYENYERLKLTFKEFFKSEIDFKK